MDDRRVLSLSVLILALAVLALLNSRSAPMHAVLARGIEWKPRFAPLSCPPDLPPGCIILWGP
jgi:hypothetical protein